MGFSTPRLMLFSVCLVLALSTLLGQENKRLSLEHYMDMESVSNPQISPDGSRIIYTRGWIDKVNDRRKSSIWIMNADGSRNRHFIDGGGARWSPDGTKIAFAANTYEGTSTWYQSLYIIPAEGGEPEIYLEDFNLNFGSPIWSRDGRSIFWSTGRGTTISLFSIDLGSSEVDTYSVPIGANGGWDLSHDGMRWVFSHSSGEGRCFPAHRAYSQACSQVTPVTGRSSSRSSVSSSSQAPGVRQAFSSASGAASTKARYSPTDTSHSSMK